MLLHFFSEKYNAEFTGEGGKDQQRWIGYNCLKTGGAQRRAAVARSGVMICYARFFLESIESGNSLNIPS